jgi:hypothetical protein
MRNVFVGVLWAIGAFLFLYKGYSRREDIALNIAGVAAVMIAAFPMDWPAHEGVAQSLIAKTHFASAAIFFLSIAYVCVFCAKETLIMVQDANVRRRLERIYTALGGWMIATPVLIFLLHTLLWRPGESYMVLLIEIAGVWVFSSFWLVKSYEIFLIEQE